MRFLHPRPIPLTRLNVPTRPKRSPNLLLPMGLTRPHLSSSPRIFKPPLLMLRLRHHLRHHQPVPFAIHRHKRQVRRRNMPQPLLPHILHHHSNPYLHGRPKRSIDTRLQNQQLPNLHRSHKIQMIHTRCHRKRPRMPARRHCPHQIDVLHQPPAKQTPYRIRVRRKHNLTPLRLRLRHLPLCNLITHIFKSKSQPLPP
jgi:hypothetical protein